MRTVLTCTLVAALLQQYPPAPPPRDSRAPAAVQAGTGVVRGRVYDRETGAPVANVGLTLSVDLTALRDLNIPPAANFRPEPPRQTRTDAQGRYMFDRLPAGAYRLTSAPPEYKVAYLPQAFGATRPSDPTRPTIARPLPVADGQVLENVDIPLWRSLAITGRVVDELGEPLAGLPIAAAVAGTAQRVGSRGPYQITTDDRGVFRLFGLAPGRYVVCAVPQGMVGRGDDGPERYVKTCAPSAGSEAEGQVVELTAGDYGEVEIRMVRGRAYKVTGVAIDSQGRPVTQISIVRVEGAGGMSSSGAQVEANGRFTINGVTTGDYTIAAQVGNFGGPAEGREREYGTVPIRVDGADVENLVVATARGLTVAGRVVFEGTITPPAAGLRVMLRTMPGSPVMMAGPAPTGEVKADQSFELSGIFGAYGVGLVGLRSGWLVKAVRLGADDVTDRPIQFHGDSRLEIVVSNRVSTLTGRAVLGQGEEVGDYRVLLFPADRERWNVLATSSSTSPRPDGTYKLGPVRPGEYFVALIRQEDMPPPLTAATAYEKLSKIAQRVTLLDDETKEMELTIAR